MPLVIFCGSRGWRGWGEIRAKLGELQREHRSELVVVTGGARGADMLAKSGCMAMGIAHREILADWVGKGRAAGPIRNRQMLELGPAAVYAFKEARDWNAKLETGGTEHMVRIALLAKVPCYLYDGERWRSWDERARRFVVAIALESPPE